MSYLIIILWIALYDRKIEVSLGAPWLHTEFSHAGIPLLERYPELPRFQGSLQLCCTRRLPD